MEYIGNTYELDKKDPDLRNTEMLEIQPLGVCPTNLCGVDGTCVLQYCLLES